MPLKFWSSTETKGHAIVAPIPIALGSLKRPDEKLAASIAREGELPDNLHGAGHPIISQRLVDALADHLGDFRFPVEIKGHKEPYFLLRPSSTVNVVSFKESEGIEWSGQRIISPASSWKKLVLSKTKTDRELLSPECFPGLVAISDKLARSLVRGRFTGLHFIEASAVTAGPVAKESSAELERKAKAIAVAERIGASTAASVQIEDGADLSEQADAWWWNNGVPSFEDDPLPDTWRSDVRDAFIRAFLAEAKKPKKAKPKRKRK